jgi:hypothetical protein
MQKMSFFFNLDSAKLVPIDKVAGKAGGTTIVIKSSARMMIKCQASFSALADDTTNACPDAHLKSYEIDERGDETNSCNSSHEGYVAECISVEFEACRFWKQH